MSRFPALDALLILFLINLVLQPLVDPDFGWHLRTGLDLLQNGWQLPDTDPYSHTLPDWRWVEHAWLTDGLLALLYTGLKPAGGLAIIAFFAAVTAGALWLAAATARAGRTQRLLAMTGAAWIALPFLGARTQMLSLLGVALVLWLWACRGHRGLGGFTSLPLLFFAWANLHGGFTAGLFLVLLFLAASITVQLLLAWWPDLARRLDEPVLTWPQIGRLALIAALAGLATLCNPYGWRLHQEIYTSLSDRFMLETLHEWQPVSPSTKAGLGYLSYLIALAAALIFSYRRVEPVRWIVLLVFLGFSLRHWRNVPLFLLLSVPLWAESLSDLAARLPGVASRKSARLKLALFIVTVCLGLIAAWLGPEHLQQVAFCGLAPAEYFRSTEYPIEAVEWAMAHRGRLGARLYNDYGFGGFLLWWLPQEKIFIDGRMPAWRIGDRWIFYDYLLLTAGDPPALEVLDKYHVDWALVELGTPLDWALTNQREWHELYADTKVAIYLRR